MHWLKDQSGISMLKVLVVLVVLGIGINEGIKYLRVQMHYQEMKDAMNAQAAAAQVLKDNEIRIELTRKAKDMGLKLTDDDFLIDRDDEGRRMTIKTSWQEEVTYLGGLCGEQCRQIYRFQVIANEVYSSK